MGALLAEFLEREADRLRRERPSRERQVDDWRRGVTQLLDTVEGHVRAADAAGVVACTRSEVRRSEQPLGTYAAPYLTITLGDRAIHFVPYARYARYTIRLDGKGTQIENTGCVVVKDSDGPDDGPPIYTLYRSTPYTPGAGFRVFDVATAGDPPVQQVGWFVRRPGNSPDTPDEPLTPDVLDRMLVGALR